MYLVDKIDYAVYTYIHTLFNDASPDNGRRYKKYYKEYKKRRKLSILQYVHFQKLWYKPRWCVPD
jgi:hypothetical protein